MKTQIRETRSLFVLETVPDRAGAVPITIAYFPKHLATTSRAWAKACSRAVMLLINREHNRKENLK